MSSKRKIFLSIVVVLVLTIFSLPGYVRKAVWNLGPSIDDYTIFQNRIIQKGAPDPWPLASDYNKFKMGADQLEEMEAFDPVSFLVIQHGKIKFEKYWDGYSEESLSNSFSAAKSVVALMIGIALDEGYIKDIDQQVGDFIPSYSQHPNDVLTIRHLLTMSSGLNWVETYTTPFSPTAKAYYDDDINSLMNDLKIIEQPGKEFEYLSGNTQLLAMVLEEATGKRISDYASEKLWKPMGAERDALWCLDDEDGMEKAYCCFNTNARDFARFGQLVLNHGGWDGRQIISRSYLNEAISPQRSLVDKRSGKEVDFYGYQYWIVEHNGMQIPYMRGILGQYIFSIPEKDAVVVRLGHHRSNTYIGRHPEDVFLYLDIALKMLD